MPPKSARTIRFDQAWKAIARRPGIAVQALMVQEAIHGFAAEVAKKYPPGAEVSFIRGVGETKRTIVGKVSDCQYRKEDMPSSGLLVEISPEEAAGVPKALFIKDNLLAVLWINLQNAEGVPYA